MGHWFVIFWGRSSKCFCRGSSHTILVLVPDSNSHPGMKARRMMVLGTELIMASIPQASLVALCIQWLSLPYNVSAHMTSFSKLSCLASQGNGFGFMFCTCTCTCSRSPHHTLDSHRVIILLISLALDWLIMELIRHALCPASPAPSIKCLCRDCVSRSVL